MGRPPNTDPAITRDRILQAAVDLFGENGREGAAIRAVARRAEVSMSTVLHHFRSKQGLFDACVDAMFDELDKHRHAMVHLAAGPGSSRETVDQLARQCFRFAQRHQRLLRVILSESVTTGRVPAGARARVVLPTLEQAAGFVSELSGQPPASARLLVLSICHIITRFVLTDPEELALSVALAEPNGNGELQQLIEDHVAKCATVLICD